MSDVLTLLEADHRVVESLLDQLSESDPGPEREKLVQQLTASLELHMEFEENQIYPLLAELDEEMRTEADNEHMLTRDGLVKLVELVAEPGFAAVVDMLKGGIDHHVKDEEEEAFPKLRESLNGGQLEKMSGQLMSEKRAANVLEAELAQLTKEQLLESARVAGVEGRSSMSVDELRSALLASAA